MNIIHAGGKINNIGYTNSYESILHNIKFNQSKIFEIDVIKIKDSYVIAHNFCEKNYGLDKNFTDCSIEEYNKLKIYNTYTPMNFNKLKLIVDEYPEYKFILDIKENGIEYYNTLCYIQNIFKEKFNTNLIPQVYCIEDINYCINLNCSNCLVALWKYNISIYTEECYKFLESIDSLNINIFGISVWFYFYSKDNDCPKEYINNNFDEFKLKCKNNQIYFHGQMLSDNIIDDYNKKGILFFKC